MIIVHTKIYRLVDYSNHLKGLTVEDKASRFGYPASNASIDSLILQMVYHPKDHELWYAKDGSRIVGWGHMARDNKDVWELAVSVDHDFQRKGIANDLMSEMLAWAKFRKVSEVFMHCIDRNLAIKHLAQKHKLVTRERGSGEQTDSIELPEPTFFESTDQRFKEQAEIMKEFTRLRKKLTDLWSGRITN